MPGVFTPGFLFYKYFSALLTIGYRCAFIIVRICCDDYMSINT